MVEVQRIGTQDYLLAESPRWIEPDGAVMWVDIDVGQVYSWSGTHPEATPQVVASFDAPVTGIVPARGGGYGISTRDRVHHLSAGWTTQSSYPLPVSGTGHRLNDIAVDPAGRLLVGSMAENADRHTDHLWVLDHDGAVRVLDDDLTISNGLGWSPDGGTLYSVDSGIGTIYTRPYSVQTGAVGPREVFLRVDPADGVPDGLAVDEAGTIWVALWGGSRVRGYRPDGSTVADLPVPALLTTSCAFTGPDLQELVITSAAKTDARYSETRAAGGVFRYAMTVPGLPQQPWHAPGSSSASEDTLAEGRDH